MFKPVALTADEIRTPTPPLPEQAVNNVFKVFHGFYGNLFLSKFSTGEVDTHGGDAGIVSARQIWGHGLRGIDAGTVKAALAQCMERHPEFPPNLPQFQAICHSAAPRKTFAEQHGYVALPPPKPAHDVKFDAVGDGKDWARRILAGVEAGYRKSPTVELFAKQALGVAK